MVRHHHERRDGSGYPDRPDRREHPAGRADHRGRRHLRRHHVRSSLPPAAQPARGAEDPQGGGGHAARRAGRDRVPQLLRRPQNRGLVVSRGRAAGAAGRVPHGRGGSAGPGSGGGGGAGRPRRRRGESGGGHQSAARQGRGKPASDPGQVESGPAGGGACRGAPERCARPAPPWTAGRPRRRRPGRTAATGTAADQAPGSRPTGRPEPEHRKRHGGPGDRQPAHGHPRAGARHAAPAGRRGACAPRSPRRPAASRAARTRPGSRPLPT